MPANWVGGTTAVTQVDTATVSGTWALNDTIRTTLYDESGVSHAVTSTSTGTVIETNVIDPHIADLNNSSDILFARTTWAKATSTTFTGTADLAGRPISGNIVSLNPAINRAVSSVPVGSGLVGGSTSLTPWAQTTANVGPNDGLTAANWSAGSLPADNDTVLFLPHATDVDFAGRPVSYDLLYGLDHSSIDLKSLKIGRSYRGTIGDSIGEHYFVIDCRWPASTAGVTVIDSSCPAIWLGGTHDAINVAGLPAGQNALQLKGGTIDVLRMLGARVRGKITVADNCPVLAFECFGANMDVVIGVETSTFINTINSNGGNWLIERAIRGASNDGVFTSTGGTYRHTIGLVTVINNYGGIFYYNGSGTLAALNNYAGTTSFEENIQGSVTVSAAKIWSGQILDKSGLANVIYSANVIVYGGSVSSDTATTQQQT